MLKKFKTWLLQNYLLTGILALATFIRFYKFYDFLGFWYDQGRDALVIWDMIYHGKFTLIGPMMGYTGMFRGAWYYYLITPFYALGGGNPVWPNVFLILTSIVAIYFLYKAGEGLGGKKIGLMAALIASVSYYLVGAARWLSDPTPTLLTSVLLVWALFKFLEKKIWALPLVGLLVGLSLQFSAATEIFFIPAILIILWLKRKIIPSVKTILISVASFLVIFIPQGLFELRHPGVLSGALFQFIFHEKTFTISFWNILASRLSYDYNLFYSKFWVNGGLLFAPFFIIFVYLLATNWKTLWKDDKFKVLFTLCISPFVGTLFFIGNLGNIYDFYFTGYYQLWILLFSFILIKFSSGKFMKAVVAVFAVVAVTQNLLSLKQSYSVPLTDSKIIAYPNQLAAIDWIYKDANGRDFNVDEYVPPVIPYAYQYLFEWLGTTKYKRLPVEAQVPLLYTLTEADPDHPDRIGAWFTRQKSIGKVQESATFGGITVERRLRINEK